MTTKLIFSPDSGEPKVIFVQPYQKSKDTRLQSRYQGVPMEVLDIDYCVVVSALDPHDGGILNQIFRNETVTNKKILFPFVSARVVSLEHRAGNKEQW